MKLEISAATPEQERERGAFKNVNQKNDIYLQKLFYVLVLNSFYSFSEDFSHERSEF